MTTVSIFPIQEADGEKFYCAIAGNNRSLGKTPGQALDALALQLGETEFSTLLVLQDFRPDAFFSAEQQKRLSELMTLWRASRDQGETLSAEQKTELDALVEAELKAATARSAALIQQANQ